MKKVCLALRILATGMLGFQAFADSQIIEINGVQELFPFASKLEASPRNTLVLFDCDDVLFCNHDAALGRQTLSLVLGTIKKECANNENISMEQLLPQITRSAEKELVQAEMPKLIKELQSSNVPVFSLTQCSSDEVVRNERKEKLQHLGFDFSKTLPTETFKTFSVPKDVLQLKPFQIHVTKPVYDSGIVYCGSAPKGVVLESFVEWLYSLGNKGPFNCDLEDLEVVLIDDSKSNLIDAYSTCEKMHIKKFTGLHYVAIESSEHQKSIDSNLFELQMGALLLNNSWISDSDAAFQTSLMSP